MICVIFLTHLYVTEGLNNQTNKMFKSIIMVNNEMKMEATMKQEYIEILSSLEEAIVVFKDGLVSFSNDIFIKLQCSLCKE